MSAGANIKKRRLQLRMSQQELADAMGYKTRSTIAKIESGENDVSQKKLQKFATVLDTSVQALIGAPVPSAAVLPVFGGTATRRNKNVVILLSGGKSGHNRQNIPSQFVSVHGKPILVYCLEAYQAHPAIDDIYVVCLKGWEDIVRAYAEKYAITKLKGLAPAGNSGIASLKNGIDYIKSLYSPEDMVIIQEATRPMVSTETISRLLLASSETGSATICHSMDNYVQFRVSDGKPEYLDRNAIIALQSPEAHRLSLINRVFDQAQQENHPLTESCCTMLMYNLGYDICFIEGSFNNIKIAREEDIAAFGALVKNA